MNSKPRKRIARECQCTDPGCPVHKSNPICWETADARVYRIDTEDHSGTWMCEGCASDAMDSGVFTTEDK
jgi:hypothetical protein